MTFKLTPGVKVLRPYCRYHLETAFLTVSKKTDSKPILQKQLFDQCVLINLNKSLISQVSFFGWNITIKRGGGLKREGKKIYDGIGLVFHLKWRDN